MNSPVGGAQDVRGFMARPPILALLAAIAALAVACAQPGYPVAMARADHALFHDANGEQEWVLGAEGGAWQHGELDPVRYSALHAAWLKGAAPDAPLHGRDPGVQLRAIAAFPPAQRGEPWRLEAKALSGHPIRLSVLLADGGALQEAVAVESVPWNRHTHFARAELTARLETGAVVAIRIEGAHQAFDSRLRLRLVP